MKCFEIDKHFSIYFKFYSLCNKKKFRSISVNFIVSHFVIILTYLKYYQENDTSVYVNMSKEKQIYHLPKQTRKTVIRSQYHHVGCHVICTAFSDAGKFIMGDISLIAKRKYTNIKVKQSLKRKPNKKFNILYMMQ